LAGRTQSWRLPLAGEYNALNAAAVYVAALQLGIDSPAIQHAFNSFQGVKRRQEVRGEARGVLVIDDFAHHPTAIRVTLQGMRRKYPGRRLWAVFEPRSFTARSAVFRDAFPGALAVADRTLLAPAFQSSTSAGVERLDSGQVAAAIRAQGGWAEAPSDTQAIVDRLRAETAPGDVVIVMSNGGFDGLIDRLLQTLAGSPASSHRSRSA
jgi:UDP-N-acetylmuramate: L-alanyl-gamma-D-glutamyl-meso-diaminopimelate ligase